MLLASCAPAVAPPPAVTPQGEDRFLIDPRTGSAALDAQTNAKFETAWRYALAGNESEARRRLDEIRRKSPNLPELTLAEAALDIHANRFDAARAKLEKLDSPAARVYEAEIALREGDTRRALDLYRALAAVTPTANERIAQLETTLFEQLFAQAQSAPDAQAIALLRE